MATTVSTIHINGNEAENSLKGLTALAARLANELKRAELGSEAFAAKAEEWRKVKAVIDDQKSALKEYIDTYGKTAPIDKSLNRMREQHRELVKELDKLEVNTKEWLAQLNKVKDSEANLNKINEQIKGIGKTTNTFGATITKVGGMMAGAFAVESIIGFVDELRKTAVTLDTYNTKTQTVFREATRIVEDSASKQAAEIGLARSQYKLLATDIGDLLVPMGFQREEAARISTQLIDLSGALAEWSGGQKTATDVSGSLRKALMGEYEELESVGIKLSEEIVKSKLASEGKSKLTGAAMEQAKAQAVLKLILEKSQDAQTAFSNNQDSLARQSARLSASFQTIKEQLAASLIPLFEKGTTAIASMIAPQKTRIDLVQEEQTKMNILADTLKQDNITRDTKKKIIDELNGVMKKNHIPNLLSEKSTLEDIEKAQNAANTAFLKKIQLIAVEEDLKEKSKEFLKLKQAEYDLQLKLSEAKINEKKNTYAVMDEMVNTSDGTVAIQIATKRVNENIEAQKRAQEEMNKTMQIAKKMGIDIDTALGKNNNTNNNKTTGTTEPDKELEKQKDTLSKLKEQIKNFNNDINQLNSTQEQAEEIRIREKYEKQIKIAQELLLSKYPLVVKQAQEIIKELTTEADTEILALQGKHLRELEYNLKQHQNDVAALQVSDDEKALQHIRDKYAKEMAELIALEYSKNQTIAQKAKEARAALQQTLDAEIAVEEQKQADVKQQKEIEELDRDLQRRLKTEQEYNQFTGNLQQQELDQLEIQYLNILSLAEKEGRDVNAVTEAYGKKKQEINDKFNKERLKKEKETIETLKNAEFDLKLARLDAMQQGVSALRSMIGESSALSKALFAFEKGLAIATILVNLQREKSAIAAKNSALPAPIAAALTATEIAIATTRAVTSAAIIGAQAVAQFVVPQKFMGGYHEVKGQTDGHTYKARYIGQPSTGMLPASPSLVLASERGPEYFVSNEALSRPDVSWHVNAIENIMKYTRSVPQFFDGGFTTSTPSVSSISNSDPALLGILGQLVNILGNGIQAKAIIGYKEVKDLRDAMNRIQKIEY